MVITLKWLRDFYKLDHSCQNAWQEGLQQMEIGTFLLFESGLNYFISIKAFKTKGYPELCKMIWEWEEEWRHSGRGLIRIRERRICASNVIQEWILLFQASSSTNHGRSRGQSTIPTHIKTHNKTIWIFQI